jgi:hypothetical protein
VPTVPTGRICGVVMVRVAVTVNVIAWLALAEFLSVTCTVK